MRSQFQQRRRHRQEEGSAREQREKQVNCAAILTPAIILNSSPDKCGPVPLPADAMLILPGLALAYAMNSETVLAGTDGLTAMT
jgi:hypothetical protein